MKLGYILLATCFYCFQSVEAGTIQITGVGESSAPPDQFTIQMTVNSICYPSTLQAKNANALIANQIVELSKRFVRNESDKITTNPGGFIRETEYLPNENGRTKILCERKWKTWNTISITLHELSQFPEIQDELVNFLTPLEALQPNIQEQSFVQLSSPHFGISDPKQHQLRNEAQHAALNDAKAQFENFDANCHFQGAKLNSLSSPAFNTTLRYGAKMATEADSSTPTIPDIITVSAVWNLIWEFNSASGCYR